MEECGRGWEDGEYSTRVLNESGAGGVGEGITNMRVAGKNGKTETTYEIYRADTAEPDASTPPLHYPLHLHDHAPYHAHAP